MKKLLALTIVSCTNIATADICHVKPGENIQLAIDSCIGGDLWLQSGDYSINVTPNKASISLKANLHCENNTTIHFVGTAELKDWAGILIPPATSSIGITNCVFDGTEVIGVNEHSPLIQLRGPTDTIRIHHNIFYYPKLDGVKRGDCVSSVGYPTDKFNSNFRVDHNIFRECARVGVAFHSGTIGEIDHNTFINGGRAADLDGEGSGSNTLKIHHNTVGSGIGDSALALNIQFDDGDEIYDNKFSKGINIYGCINCISHDNEVSFSSDNPAPVLLVTKNSPNYYDFDNKYIREISAASGFVVLVAQKLSTPFNVLFEDDTIVQNVNNKAPIQTLGINGFTLRNSLVKYNNSDPVVGWDAEGITDRITNLVSDKVTWEGTFFPVIAINGASGGTGSLSIIDNIALEALNSLACYNTSNITGPVLFRRNTMPFPFNCLLKILL